jgi:FAD/FMN-containing dehydrogenase
MKRRDVLKASMSAALLAGGIPELAHAARKQPAALPPRSRARPGTEEWPNEQAWQGLGRDTGGRLVKLESPFAQCTVSSRSAACEEALRHLGNPYFVGDQPALTQTSGWQDAWTSQPSAYAVAARDTADVVAAVNFARTHNLRLVVKGGGHSYLGTSNAPDSLLVWTRAMNAVTLHDAFVPHGCEQLAPLPAVSVGAGAMWSDAYSAVTTRGGRYVQGGGCTTVGVAGLVQSGGFGSFSKGFGTACAGLLEAEVVTADGVARIANACTNPDLFWALKGGGGGSFGVVTRLTLRTHALPEFFGAVFGEITAATDSDYRALIAKFIDFYRTSLFDQHWGESVALRSGRRLKLSMVWQGLDQAQAQAVWAPFVDWVRARKEYAFNGQKIIALPARHFWNPKFFEKHAPGLMVMDDREHASSDHMVWAGDREQVGWFIHGYQSAWLPAGLLAPGRQELLVDSLVAASRHWEVALHFNKGLAGAPKAALDAAADTAMNPGVLDAFALAIIAGGGGPAYPGMPGARQDTAEARKDAAGIRNAMDALLKAAPDAGAYVSESDFFQARWQQAYWGSNYPALARVKQKYDPDGLFFVHHGVGSEQWSADGFTRTGA